VETPTLILHKITLEGFLSHGGTSVVFEKGVNTIVGPNGAGKSSILEAIYYALTGDGWRIRRKEDLVNLTRRSAEVELEFSHEGRKYQVERQIPSGKAVLREARMDRGEASWRVIADRATDVDKKLAEILGIDPSKLDGVVLVNQGELTKLFATLTPSERKEIIDKLLGLDLYEKIGEKLRDSCIQTSTPYQICPGTHTTRTAENIREQVLRKHRELLEKMKEYAQRKNELEKTIQDAWRRIREEKLEEKALELEKARAEKESLSNKLSEISAKASSLRENRQALLSKIGEYEKRLEEIKQEISEKTRLVEILAFKEQVSSLIKIHEDEKSKREILRAKTSQLSTLENFRKKLEELRAKHGSLERLEEAVRSLESEVGRTREQLKALSQELGKVEGQEHRLRNEIRELQERIRSIVRERQLASIEPLIAEESVDKIEALLRKTEEEVSSLGLELEKAAREEASRQALKQQVEKSIELLETSPQPECPVCKRPLEGSRKEEILADYRKHLAELEKELRELESKIAALKTRHSQASAEAEALKQVAEALKEVAGRKAELEELGKRRRQVRENAEQLSARVEKLEESLKEHRGDLANWTSLAASFDENVYSRLRTEVEGLSKELEELSSELTRLSAELSARLGITAGSREELVGKLREELEKAAKAELALASLNAEKEKLEADIRDYRKQAKELGKRIEELEKARGEIQEKLEIAEKTLRELEEAGRRLEELRKAIEVGTEHVKLYAGELERVEKELEDLRSQVKEINKAIRKAMIINYLREKIFHKDGVPRYLRKYYVDVISKMMEGWSDAFNLGFESIRLDENYELRVVIARARERPLGVSQLSGGEKVAISILGLLALHQIVTKGRIGFLALDEPTEYLDEERRRELIELLKMFKGGERIPQLIVVTHDSEVRDAADVTYVVRKDENTGYSRVEREEA
jgi:exonuclease SbcC